MEQVACAAQLSVEVLLELALALNCPVAHAVQATLALAVAAVSVYSPAAHRSPTAPQAAPSSAALKVVPALHAAQVRSRLVVGVLLWPWPAGQVACAAHEVWSAAVVNVPEAHAAHVRSLEVVGAAVWYWPAGQVETAVHTTVLAPVEKVVPATQSAHTRSAVVDGAVKSPLPAGQVACAAQLSVAVLLTLAPALNWPLSHCAHARFALTVAPVWEYPAAHTSLVVSHTVILEPVE